MKKLRYCINKKCNRRFFCNNNCISWKSAKPALYHFKVHSSRVLNNFVKIEDNLNERHRSAISKLYLVAINLYFSCQYLLNLSSNQSWVWALHNSDQTCLLSFFNGCSIFLNLVLVYESCLWKWKTSLSFIPRICHQLVSNHKDNS